MPRINLVAKKQQPNTLVYQVILAFQLLALTAFWGYEIIRNDLNVLPLLAAVPVLFVSILGFTGLASFLSKVFVHRSLRNTALLLYAVAYQGLVASIFWNLLSHPSHISKFFLFLGFVTVSITPYLFYMIDRPSEDGSHVEGFATHP